MFTLFVLIGTGGCGSFQRGLILGSSVAHREYKEFLEQKVTEASLAKLGQLDLLVDMGLKEQKEKEV